MVALRLVITIALFGSALAVPLLYYSHCWSVGLSQGDRYKGSTNEVLAESGRKKAFTIIILPKAH